VGEDREVKVAATCDVLVVGGGCAGMAAAVATARSGAKTVLVERYGFLGGLATTALVGAFCGLYTTGPEKSQIVRGIADELIVRLQKIGGAEEKHTSGVDSRLAAITYDPELFKFAAEQMVLEAGVDLQFHTLVTDVLWERPGVLRGAVVENKSGRQAILASVFVDASGDADLVARAGLDFEYGDGQGGAQAMTTIFKVNQAEPGPRTDEGIRDLRQYLTAAKESGRYHFNRVDPVVFRSLPAGTISLNLVSVRGFNATEAADLSLAEIEGRRQVLEYFRAMRDLVPGFEHAQLVAVSPQIGVRETRRIIGDYVLTEGDVLAGRKFDDGIGLGAWPVEMHNPETGRIDWRYVDKPDDCYSIPLHCLLPTGSENMMVVGRCASTPHIAQASTRVIAQAWAMGEAAGVTAGKALESGVQVRGVRVGEVQAELERRGALLKLKD
jgi:glycine/D-amino acid oxidase-like deaminating enzyme